MPLLSVPDVDAVLAELRPKYHALLAELIGFASLYGNEGPMQRRVLEEMSRLGLSVEVVKSRDDEHALNLAARIPGTDPPRHRSLVLNAHADVVPVDPASSWSHPPFAGTVSGNVVHGRGAQDDKAGVVTVLLVVEALRRLGLRLPGDLIVQIVAEEETTGNGTRALVAAGFGADGAVICDGTWPERLYHAHLGHISFTLRITGDPLAASNERRGVNPVYVAMDMVARLRAHVAALNADTVPFEGIEHPYFVNVGSFHAGVWCGSVPAMAELSVQMGFPPPASTTGMMETVEALAASLSPRIMVEPWLLMREPYRGDPAAPLIRKLQGIVQANGSGECQVMSITGYTDMAAFGTPNVCLYGPGGGRNSHGVDEHYFLDHMASVARNLALFAADWCSSPRPELA
ncbi:M20 family metallopeptidase [Roseomonas genomospecies 6]|nr:M20/M25/M40 family metallo-hydrolase [Roseomonas genomospecies 6]